MTTVFLVSLLLALVAYRERLRRRTYTLVNLDIAVRGAEAAYLNAGLAREAAEAAVARHVGTLGDPGGGDEDQLLKVLKAKAKTARARELAIKAAWEREKDFLSRSIRELYDSWY
jgi:hypothetical protein